MEQANCTPGACDGIFEWDECSADEAEFWTNNAGDWSEEQDDAHQLPRVLSTRFIDEPDREMEWRELVGAGQWYE